MPAQGLYKGGKVKSLPFAFVSFMETKKNMDPIVCFYVKIFIQQYTALLRHCRYSLNTLEEEGKSSCEYSVIARQFR